MSIYRGYMIMPDVQGKYRVQKHERVLYFADDIEDAQTWIDSEKRKEFNAKQS